MITSLFMSALIGILTLLLMVRSESVWQASILEAGDVTERHITTNRFDDEVNEAIG